MRHRAHGWMYAVFVFLAIGMISMLITNPARLVLPLIIFGAIFYLYKFPPRWLLRLTGQPPRQAYRQSSYRNRSQQPQRPQSSARSPERKAPRRKRRKHPHLRVIDGQKKDPPLRRKTQ
ncbi:hypothetical protein [Numidum massiliense]|uniref:hypothetical protein n=1 Tax=Numidum massiliense TaxID=1522315 RepID=UPI0006D5AC62|nr:hypothetical protein [Numidum massiliense]